MSAGGRTAPAFRGWCDWTFQPCLADYSTCTPENAPPGVTLLFLVWSVSVVPRLLRGALWSTERSFQLLGIGEAGFPWSS
jgi:hypothetical protein